MDTSPTTELPAVPAMAGPSKEAEAKFSRVAPREQIRAVASALERNGINSTVVDSAEQAREAVRSILPVGAEVYNNTSRTLEVIGVAEDIERSGQYQPLRPRLYQMDREMQGREMRQLSASPDWVVGSVHALTEEGSLLIASASGSQLAPIASERVTWYSSSVRRRSFPISTQASVASTSTAFLSRIGGPGKPTAFPAG